MKLKSPDSEFEELMKNLTDIAARIPTKHPFLEEVISTMVDLEVTYINLNRLVKELNENFF